MNILKKYSNCEILFFNYLKNTWELFTKLKNQKYHKLLKQHQNIKNKKILCLLRLQKVYSQTINTDVNCQTYNKTFESKKKNFPVGWASILNKTMPDEIFL